MYHKSQEAKINELSSQGTYNFQTLRNETPAIADHKCEYFQIC